MAAFPEDHFAPIIIQTAELLDEQKDETFQKLGEMVESGINKGQIEVEKMLDTCRERNRIH